MANVVSKINIKLGAQTADLQQGFASAGRHVQTFRAKVEALGKVGSVFGGMASSVASAGMRIASMTTQLVALAAALATVAVGVQGIRAQFEELDAVAKTAAATGFDTQNIIAWGHAASLAGSSSETFAKGVQRFTRLLGDAQNGTAAAVKAFEDLGLSADQLAAMSPDEAFLATADAISKLPTVAERASAAYAIFGRAGQELIHTLNLGRNGLEQARAATDRLRGVLSKQDLSGIEAANDAVTVLYESLKGIAAQLAVAFAPGIEAGAAELTEFVIQLREQVEDAQPQIAEFAENVATTAVNMAKLAPVIAQVADSAVGLTQFITNLDSTQVRFNLSLLAGVAAFAAAIAIIPKIITGVQLLIGALRALTSAQAIATAFGGPKGWAVLAGAAVAAGVAVAGVSLAFDSLSSDVESAGMAATDVAAATKVATQSFDELGESAEDVGTKVDDAAKKMDAMQKAGEQLTQSLRTPFETIADDIAHAQELLNAGVISWQTYMRAIERADASLTELTKTKSDLDATETNVGFVDRNTQAGYAAMFGKTENAAEKIVSAITTGDAQIVAALQQVITAAKKGGVTVVKRPLN